LLGHDSELDTTFLNVKNRIRHVSLPEDVLTSLKIQDCFACPYLGEKGFGIEGYLGWFPHRSLLCSDERARPPLQTRAIKSSAESIQRGLKGSNPVKAARRNHPNQRTLLCFASAAIALSIAAPSFRVTIHLISYLA
jgi:hypothetical protein